MARSVNGVIESTAPPVGRSAGVTSPAALRRRSWKRLTRNANIIIGVLIVGTGWLLWRISRGRPAA